MTATFGDFLRPAGQHITAAVSFPGEVPGNARGAAIGQLTRLIGTLARYSADLPLPDEFDPASRPLSSPARAALDMRLALRRAAHSLRYVARGLEELPGDRSHPVVTHLSAAAGHLAAGSDLLQTHFTIGPSGDRAYRSCWAPAIASEPVTAALLAELAHHARVLAPWAARLSISTPTDPGAPASACAALHTATRWLWAAGAATETAQPPPAEGQVLLNAIPANVPPPRQSPADGESVPQLCAGIAATAERLRERAPEECLPELEDGAEFQRGIASFGRAGLDEARQLRGGVLLEKPTPPEGPEQLREHLGGGRAAAGAGATRRQAGQPRRRPGRRSVPLPRPGPGQTASIQERTWNGDLSGRRRRNRRSGQLAAWRQCPGTCLDIAVHRRVALLVTDTV